MRAVVSGGAGFIGSWLVDALIERGDEVLVVDDLSNGHRANLSSALSRGATLVPADVCDSGAMQSILELHCPETVFHLAALIDGRGPASDPGRAVRVNVEGTVNMLDAARRCGADRFVFASSCAVYGDPYDGWRAQRAGAPRRRDPLPLTEGATVRPDAQYGQGKLGAEGYVALYRNLHGLRTVSLRLGNVYGPRQRPPGESGVVASFCAKLVSGARPVVHGDGLQTRDYLYVDDAVHALLAAADSGADGEFNIGTGIETTVLEVAAAVGRLGKSRGFDPVFAPAHPGEIERMALSCELARADLGWEFETPLDEGLERTLRASSSRADGGPPERVGAAENAHPAAR